jgi:tRNA U38,U39,U40 pseudouridine synthase TruA
VRCVPLPRLSHAYYLYRQPEHTRTIEGVLFNALVKVGAVSQDNADNPTKVLSVVV